MFRGRVNIGEGFEINADTVGGGRWTVQLYPALLWGGKEEAAKLSALQFRLRVSHYRKR
jgi:hypothetical protein